MSIKKKNIDKNNLNEVPDFLLNADCNDGNVNIDYHLKDIIETDSITLDELLILFKQKYDNNLDLTELEQCVYNHNCDIQLRNMILQLVALKLLYSKNTIPERGYERAKRFINEVNKKLNIDLTLEEIDEAINKNYTNDEDRNKQAYCYLENVAKSKILYK